MTKHTTTTTTTVTWECRYCDFKTQLPDKCHDHVLSCPAHPMRVVEAQLEKAIGWDRESDAVRLNLTAEGDALRAERNRLRDMLEQRTEQRDALVQTLVAAKQKSNATIRRLRADIRGLRGISKNKVSLAYAPETSLGITPEPIRKQAVQLEGPQDPLCAVLFDGPNYKGLTGTFTDKTFGQPHHGHPPESWLGDCEPEPGMGKKVKPLDRPLADSKVLQEIIGPPPTNTDRIRVVRGLLEELTGILSNCNTGSCPHRTTTACYNAMVGHMDEASSMVEKALELVRKIK